MEANKGHQKRYKARLLISSQNMSLILCKFFDSSFKFFTWKVLWRTWTKDRKFLPRDSVLTPCHFHAHLSSFLLTCLNLEWCTWKHIWHFPMQATLICTINLFNSTSLLIFFHIHSLLILVWKLGIPLKENRMLSCLLVCREVERQQPVVRCSYNFWFIFISSDKNVYFQEGRILWTHCMALMSQPEDKWHLAKLKDFSNRQSHVSCPIKKQKAVWNEAKAVHITWGFVFKLSHPFKFSTSAVKYQSPG